MSVTSVRRRATAAVAVLAATVATAGAVSMAAAGAAEAAGTRPLLKVPFKCNQTWRGSTRSNHSPSNRAMDLNLPSGGDTDLGQPVKASAPGKVVAAGVGGGGYGNRIIVGHGDNWSTLYAHLKSINVKVGDHVEDTTTIGTVGKSGGQEYAHLHYEQRNFGEPKSIRFGTSTWAEYYDAEQYFTRTRC